MCSSRRNTYPLLEEHGERGDQDTLEHAPSGEETANSDELQLEDRQRAHVLEMGESLGQRLLLEETLSADLCVLKLDELVLLGEAAKIGEYTARLCFTAVMDEPTGRERHEDHTSTEKHSGSQLQSEREKPSSLLLSVSPGATDVVGAVVDPETDHDTQGNAQLLKTHKRTSYLGRCDLGVVHGDNHGQGTDTHTGNETATENSIVALTGGSSALNDDTDHEDCDADENGVFTREDLSDESRVHCPEPCTEFEDGYEPALLGGVPFKCFLIRDVVAHV